MSIAPNRTPKIVQLAAELEKDIEKKGLAPGDPYLGTSEAARFLGVSSVSANRALQLLVKRDVLRRRQRTGTFVAERNRQAGDVKTMDRIHLLVHQNFLKREGLLADGVILGIQEKLPNAEIQFNFLPANDESAYVNGVVSETLNSSRTEGYVMVRVPLEVQRIVQASGLPAVIHGTPFPSISAIPWVDRDHYQSGRIAAARLIRQGLRELTVITRERTMPGDYVMLDGVRDEMSAARISLRSLLWRPLPSDSEAARHLVLDLLRSNRASQGFICRSRPIAEGAAEAIAQSNLKLNQDAGIVLLDVYQSTTRVTLPFPYLLPVMSSEAIGNLIGQTLLQQTQGEKSKTNQQIIAVELREPNLIVD